MSKNNPNEFDPESAIIDAELLVKYRMVNRAIETLERAIDSAPRHIGLREKLREIRRTQTTPAPPTLPSSPRGQSQRILSGSLADISLFDIIQILENSRV